MDLEVLIAPSIPSISPSTMAFIPSCASNAERADYLRAGAEERTLSAWEGMAHEAETQLSCWDKCLVELEARIVE
jgi:hypothetical protein